ncbi:MAG: RNase adapter RapZ, partial [Terriglobales bacterium]
MALRAQPKKRRAAAKPARAGKPQHRQLESRVKQHRDGSELVIITGMSGSGKASALKAFEDLGYY